jgi:hypothetical protein
MKDLIFILEKYNIDADDCFIEPFGTGLINNTWKVACGNDEYILQRINTNVFRTPGAIAENINVMARHLKQHSTDYLFVEPVRAKNGASMIYNDENGYFRLMPFVKKSVTYDVVESPRIAYEAASQFGLFTKLLSGLDHSQLQVTIPQFHNLSFRYEQFETALKNGNTERMKHAKDAIALIKDRRHIVDTYDQIRTNAAFKLRATHHDTKISNVLFDNNGIGLCVIDLDTTMPGYFISDVGDMMRTYLSPVSEEEKDFNKIEVREEYFSAIAQGYLEHMHNELSPEEIQHFVYSGSFLIYMQALRFLTDHINNDVYYGARYDGHNLVRTNNQITLLKRYEEKQLALETKVREILKAKDQKQAYGFSTSPS